MKKTVFVLVMLVIVAVALAGGAAFILQQNKQSSLKRQAQQAQEKMDAKEYSEAITLLKKVEAQGGSARSTFLLGKAYYETDQTGEAMKYFKVIEDKYPRSDFMPQALLYKGRHLQEAESKPKKARDVYLQIIDKYPDAEAADFALLYLAKLSYEEGDVVQAKKNLDIIIKKGESPAKDEAEFIVGDFNMKQLKSPEPGPGDDLYTLKKGDSIWKLSRQLKVPADLIIGINNLKANALTVGQQIKVPRLNISVQVDKSQRTLTLKNGNAFLKKYHVGINRTDSRVPRGDYVVAGKFEKGYEYTDPESNVTLRADDPNNPYGSRFIQLRREMGISGTNDPEGVGKYTTKGSISMRNEDVEEIYPLVQDKNSGGAATPVNIKGSINMEAAGSAK